MVVWQPRQRQQAIDVRVLVKGDWCELYLANQWASSICRWIWLNTYWLAPDDLGSWARQLLANYIYFYHREKTINMGKLVSMSYNDTNSADFLRERVILPECIQKVRQWGWRWRGQSKSLNHFDVPQWGITIKCLICITNSLQNLWSPSTKWLTCFQNYYCWFFYPNVNWQFSYYFYAFGCEPTTYFWATKVIGRSASTSFKLLRCTTPFCTRIPPPTSCPIPN